MDETIQKINAAVIEKLGIAELPEEMQAEFINELGGAILNAVITRGVETLPEDKRAEVMAFSGGDEQMLDHTIEYLSSNLENFNQIMDEESQRILTSFDEATAEAEI